MGNINWTQKQGSLCGVNVTDAVITFFDLATEALAHDITFSPVIL